MNTFSSECGNCHSPIDIPATYIGKHVKCTNCGCDFVAEPRIGGGAAKTAKPQKQSTTEVKKSHCFSLNVSSKELIFHQYCRFFGLFSIALGLLAVMAAGVQFLTSPKPAAAIGPYGTLGAALTLLINGAIHLGLAQIIKLFHSIAYNIQAMKETRQQPH